MVLLLVLAGGAGGDAGDGRGIQDRSRQIHEYGFDVVDS